MSIRVDFPLEIVECGFVVAVCTDVLATDPMNKWGNVAIKVEENSREPKGKVTIDMVEFSR